MFQFSFIILVLIASNVLFSTIPSNVAAQNAITTCSTGFGFEPCSKHDFLKSWQSLRALGGIEKNELIKKIRCVRKDNWDDSFYPENCGVFEGGYVKDVSVRFDESGFLFKKQKLVNKVSFKIIAGKATFQKIVNSLKFLDDFKFSSQKGLFINCSNKEIYRGEMYRSYISGAFRGEEVFNDGKRCSADGHFSRTKDSNFELWWLSVDHIIVNGFENINVALVPTTIK